MKPIFFFFYVGDPWEWGAASHCWCLRASGILDNFHLIIIQILIFRIV